MEPFFVHLIKSSAVLLLFLGSYHFLLKGETLFTSNRWFLLLGLMGSLIAPLITFTKTVWVPLPPEDSMAPMYTFAAATTPQTTVPLEEPFNWLRLLTIIYIAGVVLLSIRLLWQLYQIQHIKKNSTIEREAQFYHARTHRQIAPFSFFNYIFYYPFQFSSKELTTVLDHEKVHVKEYHSLDVLVMELFLIFMWFNPAAWYYKLAIKQNLEFLADSKSQKNASQRKFYQYLMLKQSLGPDYASITNPFYNSLIKKRIVMLNKKPSKKSNILKVFTIIPLLGLFLLSFNTKEVVKYEEHTIGATTEKTPPNFISPLQKSDSKGISSGFGKRKDPLTGTTKMHWGTDFKAPKGTPVLASTAGIVEISENKAAYGNYILIGHGNNYKTAYAHLDGRKVKTGDSVKTGDIIGYVGSTGASLEPHLHFEILKDNKRINPESLIPLSLKKTMATATHTPPKRNQLQNGKAQVDKIEITIDKNSTDEELRDSKEFLAKNGIDFSYTTVRNSKGEIINISIDVNGTTKSGNSFTSNYDIDKDQAIAPIQLTFNVKDGAMSIKSLDMHRTKMDEEDTISWISKGSGKNTAIIEIKKEGDDEQIYINGEKSSREDLATRGKTEKTLVKLLNMSDSINGELKIHRIKTSDGAEHIIEIDTEDHDNLNDFTVDGKNGHLYVIDGTKTSSFKTDDLTPDDIESVYVLKGKKAIEKYGKDGKTGVIEIKTKKGTKHTNMEASGVGITIDKKDTDTEIHQKLDILREHTGFSVKVKTLRRNSRGEIKHIKITYGNGNGVQSQYQQKTTTTITPFQMKGMVHPNGESEILIKQ